MVFFAKTLYFFWIYSPLCTKKGRHPEGCRPIFCGIQSRGVIYCMTVTRLTVTPLSVYTRTMYMPALNWLMFKV